MALILVLGEAPGGTLQPITGQLLAAARALVRSPADAVAVALPGPGLNGLAPGVIAMGADVVYLVDDPLLADSDVDAQVAAFEQLCRRVGPVVVLAGKTVIGRDLAPKLAFRLGAGLAQDCVRVWTDERAGRLAASRPVYGGNATAEVAFLGGGPQMATLRPGSYSPLSPDPERTGSVETFRPALDPARMRVRRVRVVHGRSEGARLEDARVVVGGGRGLGGPEPFQQLAELARLLGGAVCATRAACDAGWVGHSLQVGLTGKSIAPDLYIAVGISGASQHMAGCSAARRLVAINKDPDAGIFKEADFGVVGDWAKVLPAFIATVRQLVGP